VWFSGGPDGPKGCDIILSYKNLNSNCWKDPVKLFTSNTCAYRNPVLFKNEEEKLFYLFFNRQEYGSGDVDAEIMYSISIDLEKWSKPELLFEGKGYLLRSKIKKYNENFILPVSKIYKEDKDIKFKIGIFNLNSKKINLYDTKNLMDPVFVNFLNKNFLFCRDCNAQFVHSVELSDKLDKIKKIQTITDLSNNDSAIDVIQNKNELILCCNRKFDKRNRGRTPISLYKSKDGLLWNKIDDLDPKPEHSYYVWRYGEFSYPSLELENSNLHICYTYNGKTVKYINILV